MSQEEVYVLPQEGTPPTNALPPGISAASLKDACSLETALKKVHVHCVSWLVGWLLGIVNTSVPSLCDKHVHFEPGIFTQNTKYIFNKPPASFP